MQVYNIVLIYMYYNILNVNILKIKMCDIFRSDVQT